MHTTIITSLDELLRLGPDWERLQSTLPRRWLPLTHAWFVEWWRSFSGDSELHTVCVYQDAKLVGIAPLMRKRSRYRGIEIQRVESLVNGHSPFFDFLLAAHLDNADLYYAYELLLEASRATVTRFSKLDTSGQTYAIVLALAERNKLTQGTKGSLSTPFIEIAGTWQDFFSARSKKFRKNSRNKLNKLEKSGLTITRKPLSSRSDPVVSEMIQISRNSWKSAISTDLDSNEAGREFVLSLIDRFGRSGHVHLWIVKDGNRPVAFEFHIELDSVIYPIRADFDDNYKELSPGSVLEYSALKQIFDDSTADLYYSCADDYEYLSHWTKNRTQHADIEIFASSIGGRLLHMYEYKGIAGLRKLRERFFPKTQTTPVSVRDRAALK